MQITLIFTTKVFAPSLVLKERVLELGNGLPIFHTGRLQLNFGGIGVDYLRMKERGIEEGIHVNQLVCLLAHNLVVVADCLVFRLLIFHFKF